MLKKNRLIRFDWAIKHMLRSKANFDILEGFLSAVLNEEVTVEQILESESERELEHLKYNRVDILVRDRQGRFMIVEVQNQYESDYLHRLLFGSSRVIIDTLQLGQPYSQVAKVISISILYFNLGSGDDYIYYGSTKFLGLHTGQSLKLKKREKADGHYYLREVKVEKEIFPEYYLIQVERFKDEVKGPLDEWIYMLKNERVEKGFHARHIDRARKKLSVLHMGDRERKRYEKYLMNLASERDIMESAHLKGRAEGLKEGEKRGLIKGLKEGEKRGLIKGLKEGEKKGRAEGERDKAIEIARKMNHEGLDRALIANITGLDSRELEELL